MVHHGGRIWYCWTAIDISDNVGFVTCNGVQRLWSVSSSEGFLEREETVTCHSAVTWWSRAKHLWHLRLKSSEPVSCP